MESVQQTFTNPNPFAGNGESEPAATSSGERPQRSTPSPTQHTHEQGGVVRTTFQDPLKTPALHEKEGGDDSEAKSLEKIETVPDIAHGVVEKMKSAAHKFHLDDIKAYGPSSFFNPTGIRMKVRFGSDPKSINDDGMYSGKELLWRSRDSRKGRNSIAVPPMHSDDADEVALLPLHYTPKVKATLKDVSLTLWNMMTTFPYWDMAFWSGWSYTIGSALFVSDGVIAFGAVAFGEDFESANADKYGGPLSFFIGALFYQVGAVAAYLEAVNDGSFHGSAMRRLLEGKELDSRKMLDEKVHQFFGHLSPHHWHKREEARDILHDHVDPEAGWNTREARHLRPGSIYPVGKAPAPRRGGVDLGGEEGQTSTYNTWRWWPSWEALRTHHVYEIGYLACTIQLFGVTLYGVTAIVVLPGILSNLAWWQKIGAFWVPQAVAASCFLIASLMFMFETQEKWWKPEPKVLGWWIGFWSTVGSVGFLLIAAFGFVGHTSSWGTYQSDLATIWGSGAYLIGSSLQWYEALTKNPVEEIFNEPGEMKSYRVHPI